MASISDESKNNPNDEKGSVEESLKTESNNVKSVELEENDADSGAVNLFSSRGINICSPFNVHNSHKPVFGSNRSILKPCTLFTDANVSSPSVTFGSKEGKLVKLKPSVLANPFVKSCSSDKTNDSKGTCDEKTDIVPSNEFTDFPKQNTSSSSTENSEPVVSSSSTTDNLAPIFVPLSDPSNSACSTESPHSSSVSSSTSINVSNTSAVTETANNISNSSTVTTEFVFGQNLRERVTRVNKTVEEPINENGIIFSSEMLFSSAIKQDKLKESNVSHEFSNGNTKTLSVSAKEYEEARSVKRKYEEVVVVTGEEDEQNVLQISCKLFAFDNMLSSWAERGRGILRVNDKETPEGRSSRLVMRLLGNFRVVLNTKIWSDMNVELASKKSVRLTAIDNDGHVKIYLVTANPKDSEQLYNILTTRIQKKKLKTSTNEHSSEVSN